MPHLADEGARRIRFVDGAKPGSPKYSVSSKMKTISSRHQ